MDFKGTQIPSVLRLYKRTSILSEWPGLSHYLLTWVLQRKWDSGCPKLGEVQSKVSWENWEIIICPTSLFGQFWSQLLWWWCLKPHRNPDLSTFLVWEAPFPVGINGKRGLGILGQRPGRNGCISSQDSLQDLLPWSKIKGMCFNLPRTISSPWSCLVMPQVENVQVKFICRGKKINSVSLVINTCGARGWYKVLLFRDTFQMGV